MADFAVAPGLVTGIDVGGTKVHIADSQSGAIHRHDTANYADLFAVLEDYFEKSGARPAKIVVVMAGPRDDETGSIKLTNSHWPTFHPKAAEDRYPGTSFQTMNDMIGTAAGMLAESGVDLVELKAGTPKLHGSKLAVTLSGPCSVSTTVASSALRMRSAAMRAPIMLLPGKTSKNSSPP